MTKSKIWVLTLFPEYFKPYLEFGVVGSALNGQRGELFEFNLVNIGHYSKKNWKGVDSAPYGGGAGMVMRADVLKDALINGVVAAGNYGDDYKKKLHVVFTGPRGVVLNNDFAKDFADKLWNGENKKDLVLICGRYEGIDERFLKNYVDEEISLGDYIITGGEIASMAILDCSLRFVDGVVGNIESVKYESFSDGLLEHPQYTRPQVFENIEVPSVLLSGHHKNIELYRQKERLRITQKCRPDLLAKVHDK